MGEVGLAPDHAIRHLQAARVLMPDSADCQCHLDIAEYVAGHLDILQGLREGMRELLAASTLCNGARFTADLETGYMERRDK